MKRLLACLPLLASCALGERPVMVRTIGGNVAVVYEAIPADSGRRVLGLWDWEVQTITIDSALHNGVLKHTLYHELCHANLTGSGVSQTLTPAQEEAVCDAVATGRLLDRL